MFGGVLSFFFENFKFINECIDIIVVKVMMMAVVIVATIIT